MPPGRRKLVGSKSPSQCPLQKHAGAYRNLGQPAMSKSVYFASCRLDQLERQCLAWPHALAAAVYMPLADGLASWPPSTKGGLAVEKAILKVASFHARMHHQPVRGMC